jgi:hypothetical protein
MPYTTINKSSDYFNTKLYTGTGSSLALTGVGHQPDMVWQKVRSTTSSHRITDAVRGTGQVVYPNDNASQSAENAVTAFGTDGFTVGTGNSNAYNASSATYVAWSWKAGGGQGSSNTDGSINTTYTSANTTAGISIIKYNGNGSNGATIGHGLGVAPTFVMIKRTDTTSNWIVATAANAFGFGRFTYLNDASATTTNSGAFNDTAPSSSVITLGTWNDVNNSSGTYICYAFAEKKGFSKFGSYHAYTANTPFVYTGFKPAFTLIRGQSTTNWNMYDNRRFGINGKDAPLFADLNNAESSDYDRIDYLSNGFKINTTNVQLCNNNTPHFYMAFAEAPLVGSNNVPCTAR